MVITKNSYIKLPYGLIFDEKNKEKIRFNLPLNYKKDVLFQKVPHFAEANNPAIDDVILGNKRDDLSIQKFLLSKGVLEDAVLDNLGMIVTDRKFNNAGIRRKLDLKYPSIIKKPTASNFLFRDKKQFNVQNPVIGGLYNQLQIRTSDQLKLLKKAPRIKDLKIRNALERLKKFNLNRGAADDDDDDDDNIPGLPRGRRDGPPGPPPPPPPRPPPQDDDDDDDDDDKDKDKNKSDVKIKKFLSDKGNERIGEALAATSDGSVETRKIAFSKEITKLFPKVKEEELPLGQGDVDEFKDEADLDFLDRTDKYDFPMKDEEEEIPKATIRKQQQQQQQQQTLDIDLDFFAGGDKNSKKLMRAAAAYIGELNPSNRVFLEYLSSNFGARLLTKNKLKIHLESGQFFHNNIITNESIYDFLLKQQDETKRELYPEVLVGNDFEFYVNELLTNVQDNDYDLHTNSTAKFLLYNCNSLRLANRLKPLSIRHSQIVNNETAVAILQSNTWGYFVEQLLHFANGNISLDDFNLEDDREFERYNVIEKTSDNVNYCKQFYQEVFDDIGYFFQRMIRETPDEFLEPLKADLANEIYFYKNLKDIESHSELLRVFNSFYFKTGRFPGNYTDLILVPTGKNPSFVKSFDQISPVELNDKFQNTPSYGIAAVHFLAVLNIFFGGEKNLSQDVMTELLHNLSYQALNFENTKVKIKFDQIIKLNKNLKSLIREVDTSNINTITLEDTVVDKTKDKIELMEEELVNNVLSGKKIEIPTDFKPPMPDSASKIQIDTEKANALKRKTDESLNQIYETITKDVVTKARNDLVKSVSDYDGEVPTDVINNITSSFKQNDPVNKSVRKHVKESIKDRNQQYFKQRKPPSVVKKNTKTVKPQLKITDIVNRNISRSSSLSSIPLNEVEMISRSGSLDSISTMKREYSDQEMISRPPSVSSIRDSIKTNVDLSFEQPFAPPKPIKVIEKNKQQEKETLLTPKVKVTSKVETPKITPQVTPKVTSEAVKKKTSLIPAAKTVIAKREEKEKGKIKPTVVATPFVDVLKEIKKKREAKKINDPPTISLVNSIEKKSTIKKKTAAAKADSKIKHQELVAKWQNKSEDVEMAVPLQTGKRKKAIPKFNSTGDAKYKKEN